MAGEVEEEDSTDRDVAGEGSGEGIWVARNMW